MFAKFTPSAREVVVRAGLAAAAAGRDLLDTGFLLLALAEGRLGPVLEALGVTPAGVRAEIERRGDGGAPRQGDRELLASLGIDLDEVRRRAAEATSASVDDPALWALRRSRARPLRVALVGPAGDIRLDARSRKVVEVALWARGRGGRAEVTEEDLLWGLLADGSNQSVRILCNLGVDLRRLWSDLKRRHAAA